MIRAAHAMTDMGQAMAEARSRAVAWLLGRQQADGAFLLGGRTFEVWDTLLAAKALHGALHGALPGAGPQDAPAEVLSEALCRAWAFVLAHVREDGIAYHHRNRGTVLACTETTGLMHALARLAPSGPAGVSIPTQAFRDLLAQSTDEHGRVCVHSDPRSVQGALQTYPSVGGFALLFAHQEPAYRQPDHPIARRVRAALASPATIQRPWQYFGSEYYALLYMTWGLSWAGHLEDDDVAPMLAYIERNQTPEGAIANGIWTPTTTSTELHTALALSAVALACQSVCLTEQRAILERGVAWLMGRQRADGAVPGGIFARRKVEDIYATALFIDLLSWLLSWSLDQAGHRREE